MGDIFHHVWPKDEEHVWGPWMQESSKPPFTQYRMCVHPQCSAVDKRKAPIGS